MIDLRLIEYQYKKEIIEELTHRFPKIFAIDNHVITDEAPEDYINLPLDNRDCIQFKQRNNKLVHILAAICSLDLDEAKIERDIIYLDDSRSIFIIELSDSFTKIFLYWRY